MSAAPTGLKPEPIALIVCDQVITDAKTGKKSLIGIFNNIRARNFPCTHSNLCIYISITNGHGSAKATVRCINLDSLDGDPVFETSGPIQFPNPNTVVDLVFEIGNLRFDRPGMYSIEFLCDGVPVLLKRFHVAEIKEE